jgi:hypothetical protein
MTSLVAMWRFEGSRGENTMAIEELIEKVTADGVILAVDGDEVIIEAPTVDVLDRWTPILKKHKPALLQRLTPCPTCGETAWRETPDAGWWCEPCVIAGRLSVVAAKIWSDTLDAALWVVADDLPREQWPQDGELVYTHREVQMLQQAGPNVLQWVHAAKRELGATTAQVRVRRKGEPDHESA